MFFVEHRKSAEVIANAGAKLPLPQTVIDSYKNNVTMFPDCGDARALYAQVNYFNHFYIFEKYCEYYFSWFLMFADSAK